MLIPAPLDSHVGEDYAERLGIIHYDSDVHVEQKKGYGGINLSGGETAKPPSCLSHKYDVDSLRGNKKYMTGGELVVCTEKVHGENHRALCLNGELFIGSNSYWKK